MPSIDDQYESKHLRLIANLAKRIKAIYEASIVDITFIAASTRIKAERFKFSLYPLIEKKVDSQMKAMHKEIYSALVSGIKQNWDLSNDKNDFIVDRRLAGKRPRTRARQILYDPNRGALDAFLKRKSKGMDLSRRVWKQIRPFKKEMEQALGIHISEGRSATKMATSIKQYLNEPERLYRRVRGEDGKLHLSSASRNYHPGQGVARSSYKNALRLARNENNGAYRRADIERWQNLPFIKGYRVVLSNRHPVYDICDELNKTIYPKNFVWSGWHVNCLCHLEPVMMTDAEYEKFEDSILGIGKAPNVKMVTEMPSVFNKWVSKNADRINNWKSPPHWITENKQFVKDLLK